MSDYFDAYMAAVVSKFLEENDFDLKNVEMPEFNILDVQTNVPNSNGNTNENAYQTKAQPGRFQNVFEDIDSFLSSNSVTHEIHTTRTIITHRAWFHK